MAKHQGGVVSTSQAVATTAASTDYIDLKQRRDLGYGNVVLNAAQVVSAATAGNATVIVEIIGSNTAGDLSGTASSAIVLGRSRSYTYAELAVATGTGKAGALPIAVKINPDMASTGYRYIAARYTITVGTGTIAPSAWSAFFSDSVVGDARKFYPAGW